MSRDRLLPVAGLLVLSPVGAELLSAYQGQFPDPVDLLVQLAVAMPLYGTAALLIRELTRRAGRGWPTMLLLAAAFGLIQAGLVDQGLFNPHYIDDPSWGTDRQHTLLPGLDLSVSYLVTFVGGHVLWSFGAPIAIVEAAATGRRGRADEPWLGRVGLAVVLVSYLLAAALIVADHTANKQFVIAPVQLWSTVVAVVALFAAAFLLPRPTSTRSAGRVPSPWLVGLGVLLAAAVHTLAPPTWFGVTTGLATLGLVGAILLALSGRGRWSRTHTLAAGCAPLVANVAIAFVVAPAGDSDLTIKLLSNLVVVGALTAVLALAWRRSRRTGEDQRRAAQS